MIKDLARLSLSIFLLFNLIGGVSSCSIIGYQIGKGVDNSHNEINKTDIQRVPGNTDLIITLKGGVTWNGLLQKVSNDTLFLLNRNPVSLASIDHIKRAEESSAGRTTGTVIGVTIDLALIYTALERIFHD